MMSVFIVTLTERILVEATTQEVAIKAALRGEGKIAGSSESAVLSKRPELPSSGAMTRLFSPVTRSEQWPLALLPLKLLAKEGDRGVGDIIARTVGPIGGDAFKTWYKRIFGKDCGCGARQDVLNARWPL